MSRDALPCFVCGNPLLNVFEQSENQPEEATEFRSYGHYGSTFWDSMDGEQIVLNICDDCLRKHPERVAQQKRYKPIRCEKTWIVGREWVDRPMVAYTGNHDDEVLNVEVDELGTKLPHVEWVENLAEIKSAIEAQLLSGEGSDGQNE